MKYPEMYDGDVENFAKLWDSVLPEVRTKLSILAKVISVKAYLADPTSYAKWRKNLGESWRKEIVLPCFFEAFVQT